MAISHLEELCALVLVEAAASQELVVVAAHRSDLGGRTSRVQVKAVADGLVACRVHVLAQPQAFSRLILGLLLIA